LIWKKKMEDKKKNQNPELLDPAVVELEEKLEGLKNQRREHNKNLDFDEANDLTKEINSLTRQYKKEIKKAQKKLKRAAKKGIDPELDATVRKLDALFGKKKEAVEKEDFKAAKEIKTEMKELQKKANDMITSAKKALPDKKKKAEAMEDGKDKDKQLRLVEREEKSLEKLVVRVKEGPQYDDGKWKEEKDDKEEL